MTSKIFLIGAALCIAGTSAFAKAHDQGQTDVPGQNVGQETVAPAQTLGSAKGNRPDDKGPTKSEASSKAGY
jgi:hypothetical protein